jgi:excisionase family DNA binding protein
MTHSPDPMHPLPTPLANDGGASSAPSLAHCSDRYSASEREHRPNRVSSEQVPGNQSPDLPMPGASGSTFEPLLTLVEAARLLKVHPKTLEKWARSRSVPAYNLGRWKFRESELDAWLRRSVHSGSANPAA